MSVNEQALHELLGKAVVDFGATFHSGLVVLGDRLGLYKALAEKGPMSSGELAEETGTTERYIREWLSNQAAGGYVNYDAEAKKFYMTPEQAFIMADESSPVFLPGAFQTAVGALRVEDKLEEAFKTGQGVGWQEHHHSLFEGTERFFRPGYSANLVQNWIPALEGVEAKLQAGAKVADIGCGFGASTILMAEAYPQSEFWGFDFHPVSIEAAQERAKKAGVGERTHFEVAKASNFSNHEYDLACCFDCLHDMGDPVGASKYILSTLKPDGTWMIVEPMAGNAVEENLNPVGRAFYGASTWICTPASLDQDVGMALGAQAGQETLEKVVKEGGFTRFRRATETPFNLILEARP